METREPKQLRDTSTLRIVSFSLDKMSIVVEELRPLLRLCQFVGLTPFRIEYDSKTGRFQRFSFSLKYPVTWWYTLLFLSVIGSIYINWVTSPSVKLVSDGDAADFISSAPSSMSLKKAIGVISILTYGVLNLIGFGARFVYLRCSSIKKMLDYMQQVEDGLRTVKIDFKISLGRRIILGMLLSLCSVKIITFFISYLNVSFFKLFMQVIAHLMTRLEIAERIYEHFGLMVAIFWLIIQILLSMAISCCFQLYYLNYYVLSIYIRFLKNYAVNPNLVSSSATCWMSSNTINNQIKE